MGLGNRYQMRIVVCLGTENPRGAKPGAPVGPWPEPDLWFQRSYIKVCQKTEELGSKPFGFVL